MSGRVWLVALAIPFSLAAQAPTSVSRAELQAMERSFDDRLRRFNVDNPFNVLGLTRGLYLEGYGAVFTAELNLVTAPGISPFRPELTKDDIARVRAAKLQRVPALRTLMQEMLLASAQSLDRVPVEQQIVLAIFLFNHNWEDQTGIPRQITLQARRKELLDIAANRLDRSNLGRVIQERTR